MIVNLNAQTAFIQTSQLPIHTLPGLVGASDKHRFVLGYMNSIKTEGMKGYQFCASYDQRVKSLGIGIYGQFQNRSIGIMNDFYKTFTGFEGGDFLEQNQSIQWGVSLSPKINLGEFGKIKYTLSPAVYYENRTNKMLLNNQFKISRYYSTINANLLVSEKEHLQYAFHNATIKSNAIGVTLIFNAPYYFLAADYRINQDFYMDSLTLYSLGAFDNYYKKKHYYEGFSTRNTFSLAAGITLPRKTNKNFSATFFTMSSINWNGTAYSHNYSYSSFVGLNQIESKFIGNFDQKMNFLFRVRSTLMGAGVNLTEGDLNTGFTLGVQKMKYRITLSYQSFPAWSNYGSIESTIQYKF
jgi:hypothetical protein